MIEPHELGENAIRELALNLYKDPKSAIKEGVTNGLDEQRAKDKNERKIEIRTHVGKDDDIEIEDFGNGIENYPNFKKFLSGTKSVAGKVSSYSQIDPDISGNKGVGKLGLLLIAGGDDPLVIFYSHRPEMEIPNTDGEKEILKRQGLVVKMTLGGFDCEAVDTSDALPHPGVKVVIKHARYELLGSESNLIGYLSKMFAIRIRRGTKIFFNGNKISPPENFESDWFKLFPLSDGTFVYGNLSNAEKTESKNLQIFHKTIYVDALSFEHKVKGWINDDYIVPTSSREGIKDTPRWTEIQRELLQHLNKNFEKPEAPKLGKLGREKEKKALLLKGLERMKHLLSGQYDPNGIFGEVTGGFDKKGKLEKKSGVKLTQTGDEQAEPVIPIGGGTRGKGGRHGGIGNKPGYEDGGDHDILTSTGNNIKMREGPINPDIAILAIYAETKPVMAEFSPNGLQFIWNTYFPQSLKAFNATGPDWVYLTCPIYAQALTNLNIAVEKKTEIVSADEWQKRYAEYMKFLIDESKKGAKR